MAARSTRRRTSTGWPATARNSPTPTLRVRCVRPPARAFSPVNGRSARVSPTTSAPLSLKLGSATRSSSPPRIPTVSRSTRPRSRNHSRRPATPPSSPASGTSDPRAGGLKIKVSTTTSAVSTRAGPTAATNIFLLTTIRAYPTARLANTSLTASPPRPPNLSRRTKTARSSHTSRSTPCTRR